jgi:hypothetical protein
MDRSRRRFLKSTGLGFLALGLPPSFLVRAAKAQPASKGKMMVVVFQRGAMDGLNAVIAFKDPAYYSLRPSIAIAEPASGEERAIDLDGFYGLHPALAPLKSIYDKGHLAMVHAAGSPDNTRSHFDAQDYMEIGTPGIKNTPDGWLNRCLNEQKKSESSFRGVALTAQLPRILVGSTPALTLSSLDEFRLRNEAMAGTLRRLYTNTADELFRFGGQSLFAAMAELRQIESKIPPSAERYPAGRFGASLAQIARLIKADVGLRSRSQKSKAGIPTSIKAALKDKWRTVSKIWLKVWRLSIATSETALRTWCSSPYRSSAVRRARTATVARITATQM